MRYYKYIEIDNFEIIQQKTLEFLIRNDLLGRIGFSRLPWKEYIESCPEVLTAFDRYNIKPIISATYITTAQEQSKVHVDSTPLNCPSCPSSRINIPILNCQGSRTEFYEAPMSEFNEHVQDYNKVMYYLIDVASTSVKKVDEVEIIYPTIIRVQSPHRVNTNMNAIPRICMTLVMDKDPVFLLEDDQIYLTTKSH